MDILTRIVADKHREIALKKSIIGSSQLERSDLFGRVCHSLSTSLKNNGVGIIAEHKRRSPSKSVINNSLSVTDVAKGYESAGVSGMSVLTDGTYFGGSLDDLLLARATVNLPLLRKEFIIDEYQIVEAKAYGADAILLIAAVLAKDEIKRLTTLAESLGMEVLLEVHCAEELHKSLIPGPHMIGVNNRNLKTFEVSLETSKDLSALIPEEFVKVSESGISSVEAIRDLRTFGYRGFLIGEKFMKTADPGESASKFINSLR
ncbi:MAG TPA: indole-3-glycerol phosphate synthase TrpC, partial [Eudoraea sp.]|nr:indole-3-glycerol phosphate synthase TrpC [Eudoraea sp.]